MIFSVLKRSLVGGNLSGTKLYFLDLFNFTYFDSITKD